MLIKSTTVSRGAYSLGILRDFSSWGLPVFRFSVDIPNHLDPQMRRKASTWTWYCASIGPFDQSDQSPVKIPERLLPYRTSLTDPIVVEQVAKEVAYFRLRPKIPALVIIQSFTRMLLARKNAMMMTKKKASDCLDEERDTHSLVSTDDLLHGLDQPAAKGQIIFDSLNVHYIGASEDPRKIDDSAESEVLGDVHADVNQRCTDNGSTPLHLAVQNDNLDVVRYLSGDAHSDVRSSDEAPLNGRVPFANFEDRTLSRTECNDVCVILRKTKVYVRPVIEQKDPSLARMTRGQRILRLVNLIGILDRQEHTRTRTLSPSAERAVRYRGVVSSEQMQAAVIGLVGSNGSMSYKCKSMLTKAFRVYLMLLRAAERRRYT